jgi:nucleoside-diphosphate-sugar epimerase
MMLKILGKLNHLCPRKIPVLRQPNFPPKTVLITGAAGTIGVSLRRELADYYQFRCLDRRPIKGVKHTHCVDITNFKAVLKAMKNVDAVIHLAANPSTDQVWKDVYHSGIQGTFNVFEAARQLGIKQIVYASSCHVSVGTQTQLITPQQIVRPDSLYAVGKAFGENLGQYFADQYNLSIICLRIGWFYERPTIYGLEDPCRSHWCSARDLAQLVHLSLTTPELGFQIFYGVSNNTRRIWDISNAQDLVGYNPRDNAETLLQQQSGLP